eukprot:GCRY01004118.1.p1 GENE.GCRY01004118.1~~GCRY01004118.1.p1  ORF type:complete len:462 (-),score=123.97 GCRY01004118.1:209-1594(-)
MDFDEYLTISAVEYEEKPIVCSDDPFFENIQYVNNSLKINGFSPIAFGSEDQDEISNCVNILHSLLRERETYTKEKQEWLESQNRLASEVSSKNNLIGNLKFALQEQQHAASILQDKLEASQLQLRKTVKKGEFEKTELNRENIDLRQKVKTQEYEMRRLEITIDKLKKKLSVYFGHATKTENKPKYTVLNAPSARKAPANAPQVAHLQSALSQMSRKNSDLTATVLTLKASLHTLQTMLLPGNHSTPSTPADKGHSAAERDSPAEETGPSAPGVVSEESLLRLTSQLTEAIQSLKQGQGPVAPVLSAEEEALSEEDDSTALRLEELSLELERYRTLTTEQDYVLQRALASPAKVLDVSLRMKETTGESELFALQKEHFKQEREAHMQELEWLEQERSLVTMQRTQLRAQEHQLEDERRALALERSALRERTAMCRVKEAKLEEELNKAYSLHTARAREEE